MGDIKWKFLYWDDDSELDDDQPIKKSENFSDSLEEEDWQIKKSSYVCSPFGNKVIFI